MLIHIEEVMIKEKPDLVLVYGDTNSTIAGALAAVKLHIPVAHVEAGGRSFNREMPEEHNRVLTDHCSEYLFCPTRSFVEHLRREGITRNVYFVGDVMYDAVLQFTEIANRKSTILQDLRVQPKEYLLATVHRPSNTDNPANLEALLAAFESVQMPVIFPVHPRTYDKITALSWRPAPNSNLRMVDPVGYLDMLVLEQNAHRILTDSGGIQKEAYFFKVPCLTLRKDTGWMDLVDVGWNVLVGADKSNIITQVLRTDWPTETEMFFGDGDASEKIASILSQEIDISS